MLSRVSVFVLFLTLVAAVPAVAAENTDWLRDAKWGVMTHYLGAAPSSAGGAELTAAAWNAQVDAFDVPGLVEQLVSTGAKYCLFTLGQNSGHYCSPNATYDRLVGIRPSKCSRRDLVADLAKALRPHGIRLMVYLPSGAPAADPVAVERLGWRWGFEGGWPNWGKPTHERLAEFQTKWETIVREWSLRWGKDVVGWWIDGCYFADDMYRADKAPNFASFAAALKAGNPDAIVSFNPGIKLPVVCHTKHEDYTAGEVGLKQMPKAIRTCPGRWIERDRSRVQYQLLTFLGDSWCRGKKPQQPDKVIIDYVRSLNAKGGVVTFDVPIGTDGLIPQPFVDQLKAIGQAVR